MGANSSLEVSMERKLYKRRVLFFIFLILYIVFLGYGFSPLFNKAETARISQATQQFKYFRTVAPDNDTSSEEIPITPLVSVVVTLKYVSGDLVDNTSTVRVRYDNLVLISGTIAIIALASLSLPMQAFILDQPHSSPSDNVTTVAGALKQDVGRTLARSEQLYNRSTLLLTGGITLAFVGVTVFYITLPGISTRENFSTLESYFVLAIRPTGVLIFIEAIAWFLLRQYRSMVEDYKIFYRLHLIRSNYLVSYFALKDKELKDVNTMFVQQLLSENLSSKLSDGETTEKIEIAKIPESNLILDLLKQSYFSKKDE